MIQFFKKQEKKSLKTKTKKLKNRKKNDTVVMVELGMNYLLFPYFYYFDNDTYIMLLLLSVTSVPSRLFFLVTSIP